MVKFPDKCVWQNRFNPYIKGAWSDTQMGPRPYKGTVTEVYRWGLRRWHGFSLGLYTSVF